MHIVFCMQNKKLKRKTMNTLSIPTAKMNNQSKPRQLDAGESRRLKERIENNTQCEILFSRFDRGRYATDASHYQIFPHGVVIPRVREDLGALIEIAKEFKKISLIWKNMGLRTDCNECHYLL